MTRLLGTVSLLALISAGILFALSAAQWLGEGSQAELGPTYSVLQEFKRTGVREKENQEHVSPLVKQAAAFALYLNPPKPLKKKASASQSVTERIVSTAELPKTTPKFILLATSYYRVKPEESLALVSEPGMESRWVTQGTRLGHFVVENIQQGKISCKDRERLIEMAIDAKAPARSTPNLQTTLASGDTDVSLPAPPSSEPVERAPRRPMHKLGPVRPEKPLVAKDQGVANG